MKREVQMALPGNGFRACTLDFGQHQRHRRRAALPYYTVPPGGTRSRAWSRADPVGWEVRISCVRTRGEPRCSSCRGLYCEYRRERFLPDRDPRGPVGASARRRLSRADVKRLRGRAPFARAQGGHRSPRGRK